MKNRSNEKPISIHPTPKQHIVVFFGDIIGFTHWTKSRLYSYENFHKKVLEIYQPFLPFIIKDGYFVKLMGDGLIVVVELTADKKENSQKIVKLIVEAKEALARITSIVNNMSFPRPLGFRIRMVAGDVSRITIMSGKRMVIDYVGEAMNTAKNLLNVHPSIPFMAHETIKELIDFNLHPNVIPRKLKVRKGFYKGIDQEDLAALWTFDIGS